MGETMRAANWGLNGYSRQTTPLLAARSDEIVNFQQVRSCGTSTAHSLPVCSQPKTARIMTKSKPNTKTTCWTSCSAPTVEVTWLENDSGCKGACGKVPNTDVTSLNLPEYCRNDECLDNILLTKFDEVLNKNDKDEVLILHTIGSHGPMYYERIPKPNAYPRRPATPTKSTNATEPRWASLTKDTVSLYVDLFIDKVIRKLVNCNDLDKRSALR